MKPIHEQEWKRDEHRAGVIHATDAITLEVKVAFWRIPGGDAVALRRAREVEAVALAAPDALRALLPLARFVEAFDAKPLRGVDDVLYGIHCGTKWEAEIRLSDLRKAVAALKKAGVL